MKNAYSRYQVNESLKNSPLVASHNGVFWREFKARKMAIIIELRDLLGHSFQTSAMHRTVHTCPGIHHKLTRCAKYCMPKLLCGKLSLLAQWVFIKTLNFTVYLLVLLKEVILHYIQSS